jgi:hypothetical protein
MGGWAVAQSSILLTTITLERLRKRGYEALLTYYEKIAPHLNEPLYMFPTGKERSSCTYSGVSSSPYQLTLVGQLTRLPPGLFCFLSFYIQFAKSFLSAVRLGRQALWLVLVVCLLFVRPANVLDYEALAKIRKLFLLFRLILFQVLRYNYLSF